MQCSLTFSTKIVSGKQSEKYVLQCKMWISANRGKSKLFHTKFKSCWEKVRLDAIQVLYEDTNNNYKVQKDMKYEH